VGEGWDIYIYISIFYIFLYISIHTRVEVGDIYIHARNVPVLRDVRYRYKTDC